MALSTPIDVNDAKLWTLEFALPSGDAIKISGRTCWTRPAEHLVGIIFDTDNPWRMAVKTWVESFLGE